MCTVSTVVFLYSLHNPSHYIHAVEEYIQSSSCLPLPLFPHTRYVRLEMYSGVMVVAVVMLTTYLRCLDHYLYMFCRLK
jgi:hypothetical protein